MIEEQKKQDPVHVERAMVSLAHYFSEIVFSSILAK
jgi:hypothetical protein